MIAEPIPARCPVCRAGMVVSELSCEACGTSVCGRFALPELCRLPDDLYRFLMVFIKNRGVIREIERELEVSYPTVRSRLDALLSALGFGEHRNKTEPREVIDMLERGEVTPEEAERILRGEQEQG